MLNKAMKRTRDKLGPDGKSEVASHSALAFSAFKVCTMKRYRLLVFAVLGIAVAFAAALARRAGGIGAADFPLLVALNVIAGLFVVAIVFDTAWPALQGEGQACKRCGHLRQMSSFRVYGACPNCGE